MNSERSKQYYDQREFMKARNAMGCVTVVFDLSSAFILYQQLSTQEQKTSLVQLVESETDQQFAQIIDRNFFKGISNENAYLFKEHEADAMITDQNSSEGRKVRSKISNLQHTPDAFSETEDEENLPGTKKQKPAFKEDVRKTYASCRKLMLDLRAVVRDA